MSPCSRQAIEDYIAGRLDVDAQLELHDHLAQCRTCRDAMQVLHATGRQRTIGKAPGRQPQQAQQPQPPQESARAQIVAYLTRYPGASASELRIHLGLPRSSLSPLLTRLARTGIVVRQYQDGWRYWLPGQRSAPIVDDADTRQAVTDFVALVDRVRQIEARVVIMQQWIERVRRAAAEEVAG